MPAPGIVLTQQVLAVVVAVGRAHDRVNMVSRGLIVVEGDAPLMVELDQDYGALDLVVVV